MQPLWQADELAQATGAQNPGFDVAGISIDTRTIRPGDLFVALQAARDGHDFVAEAFAKGAAGALVSRDFAGRENLLRVDDTLAALRRLGGFARARGKAKIVAVTGSVGKTTTKEMLRRMLAGFGAVHAADASFNNHIGVPLTLARLPADADYAVLEIGMNHAGEIAPLAALARPDVAIITGIERVHLGLLGSLANIAAEKAMIFQGLAPQGTAILPHDSEFFGQLAAAVPAGARAKNFGAAATADARLLDAISDATSCRMQAQIFGQTLPLRLAAPGRHMALNALASLAAAAALGLDLPTAAAALENFAPLAGRGARRRIAIGGGAAWLLDESYNASAASIRAALAVLALQPGRHIAVLGDILELGEAAAAEHIGLAPDLAVTDQVFTCGPKMRLLFEALPASRQGAHEPDAATLAPRVKAALLPGDAVLVKGSYGSRMRDVVAVLEGAA